MTERPAASTGAESSATVATLVSLNVGLPKEVTWRGRTVFTGIWKDPVDGPRRVRRLNIDGDGQGDACDADDDGDGLPDSTEAALHTDPLRADSDVVCASELADEALDLRPGELALVVPLVAGLLFLSAWPASISNHSFFGPSPTAAVKSGFK